MHWFPGAGITNQHGLKTANFCSSKVRKGPQPRSQQGCASRRLWGDSARCMSFPAPEACCFPWLVLQSHQRSSSGHSTQTDSSASSHICNPCNNMLSICDSDFTLLCGMATGPWLRTQTFVEDDLATCVCGQLCYDVLCFLFRGAFDSLIFC